MTGEGHIDDRRADPVVLHDIYHRGGEVTRLPAKGTTWLEDEVQVGVALAEGAQYADQMLDIVVTTGHQMATAHVEPLEAREEVPEVLLDDL